MQDADFLKVTAAIEGASKALGKVDVKEQNITDPQGSNSGGAPAEEACQWAHLRQCTDGKQGAFFNTCATDNPDVFYYGFQSLTFSDPTCKNDDPGDNFLHSFLILFVNAKNGVTSAVSTLKHKDYRDVEMGGAELFTLLQNGFSYHMLGRRLTYNGYFLKVDISQRTPQPIIFIENQEASERFVSGYLETNHNIAKFTSLIGFDNVKWEPANCCYPVSGTASVEFSGSVIGKAAVKFTSCERAEITINSETRQVDLAACQ